MEEEYGYVKRKQAEDKSEEFDEVTYLQGLLIKFNWLKSDLKDRLWKALEKSRITNTIPKRLLNEFKTERDKYRIELRQEELEEKDKNYLVLGFLMIMFLTMCLIIPAFYQLYLIGFLGPALGIFSISFCLAGLIMYKYKRSRLIEPKEKV